MSLVMRLALAIGLCTGVLACDHSTDRSGMGTVMDSAGVRVVDLSDASRAATRTLALDSDWGMDGGLVFGELTDVELTPRGQVVLLDRMTGQVTVLSPEGVVENSFGREGEGPGEFIPQGLTRVVATDSTLLVPDLALQRITEFFLDGEVVAIHRMLESGGTAEGVYGLDWRAHPAGGIAYRELTPSGALLLRWNNSELDTLHSELLPRRHNLLLPPTLLWDIGPRGRLVIARSDETWVKLLEGSRPTPTWIALLRGSERVLADADRRRLEQLLVQSEGGDLTAPQRERILASVEFPATVPILADVRMLPEGEIWVQHAKSVAEMEREALRVGRAGGFGGRRWDILTANGLLRAVVLLPEGFTPKRLEGRWIYGVLTNELGVQTVARVARGE